MNTTEVIRETVKELYAQGVLVSPAGVRKVVDAVQARSAEGKAVSVGEAIAAVHELLATLGNGKAEERVVTGVCLSPRRPDGSGGEVIKNIRVGPAVARQYAVPRDYPAEPRLSETKRIEVEAELRGVKAQLESPDLTPAMRIKLEQQQTHLEKLLGVTNAPDARRGQLGVR